MMYRWMFDASSSANLSDDRGWGPAMMGGYPWLVWPIMVFGLLISLLIVVALVLVIVWLWKQINGRK